MPSGFFSPCTESLDEGFVTNCSHHSSCYFSLFSNSLKSTEFILMSRARNCQALSASGVWRQERGHHPEWRFFLHRVLIHSAFCPTHTMCICPFAVRAHLRQAPGEIAAGQWPPLTRECSYIKPWRTMCVVESSSAGIFH